MKPILDNFSNQAQSYKKYRPTYPSELYRRIQDVTPGRNTCWDCGTGNGQVAVELSNLFETVHATDISNNQVQIAEKRSNIIYGVERAEKTRFDDQQFDLVTVAQAIHWFDIEAFNQEVKRVCKPEAIIAVWGYGLIRIEPAVDKIIDWFYHEVTGPYWNAERKLVDDSYRTIPFDFKEIRTSPLSINNHWDLEHLNGYFNSWSAVQHYRRENKKDPVPVLMDKIKSVWSSGKLKKVTFPIFMRMGQI